MVGDPTSERRAEIRIHDPAVAGRLLLRGETGAGEAYVDGQWSSPDLVGLIELAALNRAALALGDSWWHRPLQWPATLAHRARRNSRTGSRRNIHAHYDLGNDLYRLFLDESMTYSSAVFEHDGQTLADAQRAKYRRLADDAGLRPGHARPRDRLRVGRVRPVRRRRARLPGHVDHDLDRAARPRP